MPIRFSSGGAATVAAVFAFALVPSAVRAQGVMPVAPAPKTDETPKTRTPVPPIDPAALTLSIGSDAPPLRVEEWVKGEPVVLAPGKITVVDFWATWCMPCRPAIAKSSELAKKYAGKVQFAAISVSEKNVPAPPALIADRVKRFVETMGNRMDLSVARDTPNDILQKTWLVPSGIETIPLAFIVDKDGKIAWMGNPLIGMEESLAKIVAGTYNRELAIQVQSTERQYVAKQKELNARLDAVYEPVLALARQKRFQEAVAEMDKITAANPDFGDTVAYLRYRLLFAYDEAGAQKFAAEMATTGWKNEATVLDMVAWSIVAPGSPFKKPDYALAARLAEAAVALSSEGEPGFLETLAVVYERQGNLTKAIVTGDKAVAHFAKDDTSEMAKTIRARVAAMKAKRDAATKKPAPAKKPN